jgi:outer membrane receptor protein involved in Fe transport
LLAGNPQKYQAKEWKPERVVSTELGYKGLFANKFLVDAYWYSSTYNNFSAGQVVTTGTSLATINGSNTFSFPANVEGKVKTGGWGLGIDWKFAGNFTIGANLSSNEVKSVTGNDINVKTLGYNTPKMRKTFTLANSNIGKSGFGFNITYRNQDSFVWQSSIVNPVVNQAQGSVIPAFSTLDAAITKRIP